VLVQQQQQQQAAACSMSDPVFVTGLGRAAAARFLDKNSKRVQYRASLWISLMT